VNVDVAVSASDQPRGIGLLNFEVAMAAHGDFGFSEAIVLERLVLADCGYSPKLRYISILWKRKLIGG
jgi:hypothetical protein